MSRRGENVYKRKDGRWEGRILKQDRKYQYFYSKTYREVKEKMKNFQEECYLCEKEQPGSVKNASGLFVCWIEGDIRYQVKPSTYENYLCCMQKYVIPFFEGVQITEASVTQFAKVIRDNVSISEAYKKKILSIFKTALKDILKGTPEILSITESIKIPKTESSEVQVFSVKEQRMIEHTIFQTDNKRALGIILCFYTGIRLGELCALKWSDFDWDSGTMSVMRTVSRIKNFQQEGKKTTLYIGTPKSRKSVRKIPLPDFIIKLADELLYNNANENDYVFSGGEVPFDPRTYQKLFKKILVLSGVKDRKFHAIRHTFATRALELGVDIKTLSEILGHSNVSITLNIYAHSLLEQKKIAINKFNTMHITLMGVTPFAVTSAVALAQNNR